MRKGETEEDVLDSYRQGQRLANLAGGERESEKGVTRVNETLREVA